jgi:hypothetical protein
MYNYNVHPTNFPWKFLGSYSHAPGENAVVSALSHVQYHFTLTQMI